MRVLHIFSGYGGGISSVIKNLAAVMPPDIIFDTICFSEVPDAFRAAIETTGGTVYRMENPKQRGWRAFRASFHAPFAAHSIDIVHCHMPGLHAALFHHLAKKEGVSRFLVHAHGKIRYEAKGLRTGLRMKIEGWLNRRASTTPIGCGARSIWDIYGPKVPENTMMMIPNGVNMEQLLPHEGTPEARSRMRASLGISPDTLLIAMIGRLTWVKNHEKLFEIMAWVKDQHKDALAVVLGSGTQEAALKRKAHEAGLTNVRFLGRIEPLTDLFAAADVVILPSFSEGLPTVIVEAQAAGVPSVVSDTVTREVDFQLGLVRFLRLSEDAATWWDALDTARSVPRPTPTQIQETFEKIHFTREGAGRLYADFLEEKISHFAIHLGAEQPKGGWDHQRQ